MKRHVRLPVISVAAVAAASGRSSESTAWYVDVPLIVLTILTVIIVIVTIVHWKLNAIKAGQELLRLPPNPDFYLLRTSNLQ